MRNPAAIAAFVLGLLAAGQAGAVPGDIRLNASKELETDTEGWGTIKTPLAPFIEAYSIDRSTIVFQGAMDDFLYVVLSVSGPSRSPEGASHQCGAGEESDLIWVKLDKRSSFKARAVHALTYSSCWESAEGEYHAGRDRISIEFKSYARMRTESWNFSTRHPENGFARVKSAPLQ